jgi:hypothetical protein
MQNGDTVYFTYHGEIKEAQLKSINNMYLGITYDKLSVNGFIPDAIYFSKQDASESLINL